MKNYSKLILTFVLLTTVITCKSQTWVTQNSGISTQSIEDVYFISPTQGWAVGQNGLITTTDGGTNWTQQIVNANPYPSFYTVFFISPTHGWVFGDSVYQTINGGSTWFASTMPSHTGTFSMHFATDALGWAVSKFGNIVMSSDSGKTWTQQPTGILTALNSVQFISPTQGWIAAGPDVLTTTNAGVNWTMQTTGLSTPLFQVQFVSPTQGWAVGHNGVIITTTNGGVTWTPQVSGTTQPLTSLHFVSATLGWVVGYNGTVLTTTNGGINWTSQSTGVINTLTSVHGTTASHMTLVGYAGLIMSYGDPNGIQDLQNELHIPMYPNPNNGSFAIDLNSKSQITITNILGETVLSQSLESGKQTIDIHSHTAGIYFVKVTDAKGGSSTRKIVVNQ